MSETYLIGQSVELQIELRDGDTDAMLPIAAAVLWVKKPSAGSFEMVGTTVSPDNRTAKAQLAADELGEWLTRWEVTGPPDAVHAGSFSVVADARRPARATATGERGERGPVGPAGPPGEQVRSEEMPTTGTFEAGAVVWAARRVIDVAGRRVMGWQRETTGSTHTPGTDWTTIYADVAPGPGYLLTEDGQRLTSESGQRLVQDDPGSLEPKKISQLPETLDYGEVAATLNGATGRFRIDRSMVVYIIQGVGVPAESGEIPTWDDAPAINAGIARARALGFSRVATRGVVCRIGSKVDLGGNMELANSAWGDIPETESAWRQTPRWVFEDAGQIIGQAGAQVLEFAGNHINYSRVDDGVDPDVDPVSMRAAMNHMIGAYGLAGVDDDHPNGQAAILLTGDGCRIERFRMLGFYRIACTEGGARCSMKHYRLDAGGSVTNPAVAIEMIRSGGSPDHGPGFVFTAGIKKVRGVAAVQMPILAMAQDGATGKTRVTCGWVQHVKIPRWKAGDDYKSTSNTKAIVAVSLGGSLYQFSKQGKGTETAGPTAPGTGQTLVVGQEYSDGLIDWTYDGPYLGRRLDANHAASYLLPGHRLVLGVDPRVAQLTPAGLDEMDEGKRGHVALLGFGGGNVDAYDYILDLPWNPAFATAWQGGWLGVFPGLRIGTGIVTDESDGLEWAQHQNKGLIFAARIAASNGTWIGASCEDSAEGENTAQGNPWSVGYYLGDGAAGLQFIGGSTKSVGIPKWIATGATQAVGGIQENYGGALMGIYVEDGIFAPAGGYLRGGAGLVYLGDKGWADLRVLQFGDKVRVDGTSGWQNRLIPAGVVTGGDDKGTTYHGWPGDAVFGPTFAAQPWGAIESIATTNTIRRVIGPDGGVWRLKCTQTGTTGATMPAVQPRERLRNNATFYKAGKRLYLIGADGNYHYVTCIAVTGNGLTAGSQPAVTDATTTYTDGNSTWLRLGRYLGPEAPIPDGSVIWSVLGVERHVAPVIRWDSALRRIVIAYVPNNGIGQDRVIADNQGVGLGGTVRHLDSGRDLLTTKGDFLLRRRTVAQITTNDAGTVGENKTRIVMATDAPGGAAPVFATDNGAPIALATQPWVQAGANAPGPYTNEAEAVAGGVAARSLWESRWGYLRRRASGAPAGDGVTDDRAAIQAIIDWSGTSKKTAYIEDGTYLLSGPIYARDYATIVCSPNAVFLVNFAQSGTTGALMNEVITTQLKRFRWTGGCIRNVGTLVRDGSQPYSPGVYTGASFAGNSVCLYGDTETEVSDLFADEWQARAFLVMGDLKLRRCRAISYQDGGGIRYAGWGREFRAIDCHVVCGDDALQFVPAGATGSVGFNQETVGGQYIGCTGYSWNARFMAAVLLSTAETLHMSNSIRDCGWFGCHGRSTARALTIENEDSTGRIAGITVTDCSVEILGSSTTQAAIGISASTGTGGVEDVTLTNFRIRNPIRETLLINTAGVKRVRVQSCSFDKPQTAATNCVQLTNCSEITFRDTRMAGNGTDVVLIGAGGVLAYSIDFYRCRFEEIDNGVAGVRFNAVQGATVERGVFAQRSGQTTARSVSMAAASQVSGVVLRGPHDTRSLTLAENINAFTNNGTSNNRIEVPFAVTVDSGARAIRMTECGTCFQNTGATALCVYSLPSAVQGLHYSFVVLDADGIRVACATGDKIRSGATLGAATGSITSTTIGDTLTLRCVQAGEWQAFPATGTWTVT